MQTSGCSRTSDLPLRARYSSLQSAGGSGRLEVEEGPGLAAPARAAGSQAAAAAPAAFSAPAPAVGQRAPRWRQQQQQQPEQELTPARHLDAAAAAAAAGAAHKSAGFMRLLGKLSPFSGGSKLQSPPATDKQERGKQVCGCSLLCRAARQAEG